MNSDRRVAVAQVLLVVLGLVPGTVRAQARLAAGTRQMLVETLTGDRDLALAMVDSMPARLLHFKPVPEVRDFAQQIEHVASTGVAYVARFVLDDNHGPALGDSAAALASKVALKRLVRTAFDYCLREVQTLPDSTLMAPTRFFGRDIPKWRVFLMVHSHDVWTLGSVVAYFRLNGMPPPAFDAF
jgi:DinB superfamily